MFNFKLNLIMITTITPAMEENDLHIAKQIEPPKSLTDREDSHDIDGAA